MDIDGFKQARGRGQRRPWRFTRISGIVRAYGLGEGFLDALDASPQWPFGDAFRFNQGRIKVPLELPLFGLATASDYRLTISIIARIDNPYLDYVQDPDEILLCRPLFYGNPHLSPDDLSRWHFSALLGRELAKK